MQEDIKHANILSDFFASVINNKAISLSFQQPVQFKAFRGFEILQDLHKHNLNAIAYADDVVLVSSDLFSSSQLSTAELMNEWNDADHASTVYVAGNI